MVTVTLKLEEDHLLETHKKVLRYKHTRQIKLPDVGVGGDIVLDCASALSIRTRPMNVEKINSGIIVSALIVVAKSRLHTMPIYRRAHNNCLMYRHCIYTLIHGMLQIVYPLCTYRTSYQAKEICDKQRLNICLH